MGRRSRRRREKDPGQAPPTTDYPGPDGEVLTLRDDLTAGTLRQLEDMDARPAADAEDRWQRRALGEHLATRYPDVDI